MNAQPVPIICAVTQGQKLARTAALFAVAIGLVALSAAIHNYGPLFVAWLPLVGAAWVLSRRDPGYVPPPPARPAPASAGGEANDADGETVAASPPPGDAPAEPQGQGEGSL